MTPISLRREAFGTAPLASVAPATPRPGERPTVAGVVRRRLLQAGRATLQARRATARAGRTLTGTMPAQDGLLPCGHPANQPHDRFHSLGPVSKRTLARGF